MKKSKQIAFYYETVFNGDDTILDKDGSETVPVQGDVIEKHGKKWRVNVVQIKSGQKDEWPIHQVYLVSV